MDNSYIASNKLNSCQLDNRSLALRKRIVKMLEASRRGHVGSAFSLVEIIRVLYDDILKYDSQQPKWSQRDRFILSKGHGCLALYVLLAEKGFFPTEELNKFCQYDGILGGHPETSIPGVEASTGSLGHGLSIGLGFALNAAIDKNPYRTFVVVGDGEINEGSIWEAALSAAKHRLDNLIVLIDYNKQQSYSSTSEVLELEPLAEKWRSFGWAVKEVDGHDVEVLKRILKRIPYEEGKPNIIICHTVKGKGFECVENNLEWHHKNKITDEEIEVLSEALEV